MGRKFYTISDFICEVCGSNMPLPRTRGCQRKNRHIKDMYCPVCKAHRKFKEITYKDNYKNMDGEVLKRK